MRARLLALVLPILAALPAPALAEPSDFRVAGSYSRDANGLSGELVPVYVPWEGVNARDDILSCLTGPYNVKDGILVIQRPDRLVRIRLKGNSEADWELLEATGPCAGLTGSGAYRITDTPMLRLDARLELATASQ